MRILVTAIGSMSSECVIKQLKLNKHFVVGCDIYPKEWHYESKLCDIFLKAPFAVEKNDYIKFLLKTCKEYNLQYIIPLTDLEIDIINEYRFYLEKEQIILCMPDKEVLKYARNKYELYNLFKNDKNVPSIDTFLLNNISLIDFNHKWLIKPYNGRSSEGLLYNISDKDIDNIKNKEIYIIQKQIEGNVFTVDFCRNKISKKSCVIPREELLRTKNGAGLTVKIISDKKIICLVNYIGNKLDINGCVNMEFIFNGENFYLIDINPRFSAGVAFSLISGYDMITNHLNCFCKKDIDEQISIQEQILIKKYEDIKYYDE